MSPMRRATAEDNARLLELFGAVPMQGRLDSHLYAVTPASRPGDAFPPGRTGFEIALP